MSSRTSRQGYQFPVPVFQGQSLPGHRSADLFSHNPTVNREATYSKTTWNISFYIHDLKSSSAFSY